MLETVLVSQLVLSSLLTSLHPSSRYLDQQSQKFAPVFPKLAHLDLETSGPSASTSLLELASLGLDVWFLVLVWSEAEVLDSFSGILWASEENGVAASWRSESQLIQCQNLTSGSKNAGTGGSGEAESSYANLGNGEETVVIGDSANDDNGSLLLLGGLGSNSRDRDGGSVDAGHKKSAENDFVEGCFSSASQEAVELYEQLKVDIVTLWRLAVSATDVVGVKIDTHGWRLGGFVVEGVEILSLIDSSRRKNNFKEVGDY